MPRAGKSRIDRSVVHGKPERANPRKYTRWIRPSDENYHPIGCCDCALIHVFQFGYLPNGRVVYRVKRAVGLTKARRKRLAKKKGAK